MARDDQDTSDSTNKIGWRFVRPNDPWPIDPYVESGIDLADHLNELVNAIDSTNFVGTSSTRPDYAKVGTMWCKQESSGKFSLYIYNGAEDLLIADSDGVGIDEINITELIEYLNENFDIGVKSFTGSDGSKRTGDVVAADGDYKITMMDDYNTADGVYTANDAIVADGTGFILQSIVNSFDGRTGDVVPNDGDYKITMMGDYGSPDGTYTNKYAIVADGSKFMLQQIVNSFTGANGDARYGDIVATEGDYKIDMLGDVEIANITKDDILMWDGTEWGNGPIPLLETELQFMGGINPTQPAPASPGDGDIYLANEQGDAHSSWTGIAGQKVNIGNAIGWSAKRGRWYLLGDVFQATIERIDAGTGIKVTGTSSIPVISINKDVTDTWYATKDHTHTEYALAGHNHDGVYEPVIGTKGTAFNKNFGTGANEVARGNHDHNGQYADVNHLHDEYEPKFSKNSAFNKNFGTTSGTVAQGNHTHNGYALTGHTHDEYALKSHEHTEYEPKITTKYSAFNKDFGTGYNDCARGDHTHTGYSPSSHGHTLGSISGGTSAGTSTFAFTSLVTASKGISVVGGAFTVSAYISCDGYIYSGTDLRAGGDVIAYYSSDENLKDNIRPIGNVLDKVCQIRSIEFEWNDKQDSHEGTDVGVSAQSVQKVFPSLVKERESDQYLGVRYEKLIGPAIGAISELRDMVLALQTEVAELKAKLGEQ